MLLAEARLVYQFMKAIHDDPTNEYYRERFAEWLEKQDEPELAREIRRDRPGRDTSMDYCCY